MRTYPGGRLVCKGCDLHFLVAQAFDVRYFQVSGGPSWRDDQRFDIDAKPPSTAASSHLMPDDPRVPPSEEQRQMLRSLLIERFRLKYHRESGEAAIYLLKRGDSALHLRSPKNPQAFPFLAIYPKKTTGDSIAGVNESMVDLAKALCSYFDRLVIDRTGISGSFDFSCLNRSEDPQQDPQTLLPICLREIGLKLEAGKGPTEKIVIEAAGQPIPN